MAILYEECLELYHKGVRTWDAYKQEFFPLRMLVFDVMCDCPSAENQLSPAMRWTRHS